MYRAECALQRPTLRTPASALHVYDRANHQSWLKEEEMMEKGRLASMGVLAPGEAFPVDPATLVRDEHSTERLDAAATELEALQEIQAARVPPSAVEVPLQRVDSQVQQASEMERVWMEVASLRPKFRPRASTARRRRTSWAKRG